VSAPYDAKAEAAKLVRFIHGDDHDLRLSQSVEMRIFAAALEAARAAGRDDAARLFATHEGARESITAALEAARAAGREEWATHVAEIERAAYEAGREKGARFSRLEMEALREDFDRKLGAAREDGELAMRERAALVAGSRGEGACADAFVAALDIKVTIRALKTGGGA